MWASLICFLLPMTTYSSIHPKYSVFLHRIEVNSVSELFSCLKSWTAFTESDNSDLVIPIWAIRVQEFVFFEQPLGT